ncbi:MAG: RecQ family ATP-dependent DNA helicase, partial [Actinomycetota bacterium]
MALPIATVAELAHAVARVEAGDAAARADAEGLLARLRAAWPGLDPEERDDLGGAVPLLKARLDAPPRGMGAPPRPPALDDALAALGVRELRPGQDRAAVAALCGRDALVVMATGSGKSLCYQLPALLLPGVTLVVSPLIALMRDQVLGLRERGVCAVALNSSQTEEEHRAARDEIVSGRARIVYAAPERLRMAGFVGLLAGRGVALAAIDEAHCASEWGHDFRPDYRDIAPLLVPLAPRAVMALTATATARVQDDVVRRLALRRPAVVATGADRPNIAFDVIDVGGGTGLENRKRGVVARLVAECGDRPAIVYMRTRKGCETLADHLAALGVAARPYHAQRPDRRQVQDGFAAGTVRVVCATNAFGMGVDVPDIGLVAHHSLPESVEAYSQEAGRAGRDGRPARAVLLYAQSDIPGLRRRVAEAEITVGQVEARLRALAAAGDAAGDVEVPAGALDDRGLVEGALATRIGA